MDLQGVLRERLPGGRQPDPTLGRRRRDRERGLRRGRPAGRRVPRVRRARRKARQLRGGATGQAAGTAPRAGKGRERQGPLPGDAALVRQRARPPRDGQGPGGQGATKMAMVMTCTCLQLWTGRFFRILCVALFITLAEKQCAPSSEDGRPRMAPTTTSEDSRPRRVSTTTSEDSRRPRTVRV